MSLAKLVLWNHNVWQPCKVNTTGLRVESFADDLNARRGIVSGRVALLPRSTEIQPQVAKIRFFSPTMNNEGRLVDGEEIL